MAVMTNIIQGNNGGGVKIEVGPGSTGADITVTSADGTAVTVFAGSNSLLRLAGKCAAIAQGITLEDPAMALFGGVVDYGIDPDGTITLDLEHGEVVVTLQAHENREHPTGTAKCDLDVSDMATLCQFAAAAAHDL